MSTLISCIASLNNGSLCGAPAMILDLHRGGMVCPVHGPRRLLPWWRRELPSSVEWLEAGFVVPIDLLSQSQLL